jgi:uncharacterized repeat protein (TIGR02543 family)
MKKGFFAILAVLMVFAMATTGCDTGSSPSKKDPVDADKWRVTWDADGGTVTPAYTDVTKGQKVTSLPTPTKADNDFGGWFTAKNGGGTAFTTNTDVTANITVYAKWTATQPPAEDKWRVTWDADGGTVTPAHTDVTKGQKVTTLPTPTKADNEFGGWFTAKNGGGTAFTTDTAVTANITVYAKWTALPAGSKVVTFDNNKPAYAPNGTAANPATKTLGPTETTVGTLPTDPTYDPAWAAGVAFDGWNTKADGTGTVFTKDTPVTGDIKVFAQWSFTAGEAQTLGATLVLNAPEMVQSTNASHGTWSGSINTDGSVTYQGGAFTVNFPTGYENYDFVDVDWVYTNANADQPSDMIFKQGTTQADYEGLVNERKQYWRPDTNTISGTATRRFPIITSPTSISGISLQIYWQGKTPFDVTMKVTKLTFTVGAKHTITFVTDGGTVIDPLEITEGKPFTLPSPTKKGYTFLRWEDPSGEPITNSSSITESITLKAIWKAPTAVDDILVDFNTITPVAMGSGTVDVVENGYKLTIPDTIGYAAAQVKFAITLPTGAVLGDYASLTATINGGTYNGSPRTCYKGVGVLAGSPLPESWTADPTSGEYLVSQTPLPQYQQNATTMTFNIVAKLDLTGTVEFSIYTPADDSANPDGSAKTFTVTNVKLNGKSPAAPPLEISFATTAEIVEGSPKTSVDVSADRYGGISFNLSGLFSGYSIRSYNRITIVTECYSDPEGTTLITTTNRNALFTATLFTPWVNYTPGGFPEYGTTGRLQAQNAGVNSHGDGLTYNITASSNPEGIRFERNDGQSANNGADLKNIKIVSIKFWHTEYEE